jgi:hypothetical protein
MMDFMIKRLDLNLQEQKREEEMKSRAQSYKQRVDDMKEKSVRRWMVNHGKGKYLAFSDAQIIKLKETFCNLDEDGGGSIGIDELETPLIGLGFADTREQVEEMVKVVDEDESGQIEFGEFLQIIKNSDGNEKTEKINKFFQDMSNGLLGSKDLNFNIIV